MRSIITKLTGRRKGPPYQPIATDPEHELPAKRSFLEKVLAVLTLGLLLLAGVFIALYVITSRSKERPPVSPDAGVCMSKNCVLSAADIIQNIDESVDPCDDFYAFSCKGYEDRYDIPGHKVRIGVFDAVYERNIHVLRSLLESSVLSPHDSDDFTERTLSKMKDMYNSCMNTTEIDNLGASPIFPLISSINQTFPPAQNRWTVPGLEGFRWALGETLVKLHLMGVDVLVGIGVEADAKEPNRQTIYIGQPALGLPSKEYYLESEFLKVYEDTITRMFKILFTSPAAREQYPWYAERDWSTLAHDITELERKLAEISWSNEELSDPIAVYNPYNITSLSNLIRFIDIKHVLTNVLTATNKMSLAELKSPFIVTTPSYFIKQEVILQSVKPETLNAFFIWRTISKYVDVLGEEIKKGMDEFKEKIQGISAASTPPRFETCLKYVDRLMGFAAGKFFVDKKFGGSSKEIAYRMTENVINAFVKRIETLEWLDEPTRKAAIEKMTQLIKKIGFPEFITSPEALWNYYYELLVKPHDFFGNVYRHKLLDVKKEWKKLLNETDIQKWEMLPHQVNAYYNPLVNEIVFPAGILQPPFFDASVPMNLNYGGIGLVQGHEASHGVDSMGRHYDSKGRLIDWWTPHTNAEFEERSKCFIDQYSSFYITDAQGRKVHVNGKLTLGENLADNGGLRQAWTAYQNSTRGELPSLPGLQQYSPDQLFFINFAQVWCAKYKPEYRLQAIRTDPHSPPFVRVNAAVSNSIDFAKTFRCAPNSKMNPEKKCSIW